MPDPQKIMLGGPLVAALHDSGALPDRYTSAEGTTIRLERDAIVVLRVDIVLTPDDLEALVVAGRRDALNNTEPEPPPAQPEPHLRPVADPKED